MSRSLIISLFLLFAATFSLAAEEFRVAQVQIEGNRRVATAAIRGVISINPGDVVSYAQVDENLRNIFALGGFHDVTARIDEVQGSNILVFEVEEQPLVRTLEFRDNKKLSDQKLRDNTTLKPPFIFDHNRVRKSVQELKDAYIKDAYHAVEINTQLVRDSRGEATLVYLIDEGRKIRIKNINFIGNQVLTKRELLKSIETKESWFLSWLTGSGVYLDEVMEIDVERIKMAYYDIGYQDVIVQQPQVTLVDDKYLNIDIEIDEGPQYRVGALSVSGDLLFPEEQLLEQVQLKEGEVFSRLQLRDSILALTDLYADQGYAYVNVVPLTTKRADQLLFDIELEIEQGVQVTIERVDISGNVRTRDKVIRREIPVIEGELYSSSKMKEANRRVRNLGFFEEVEVTDRPGSAEDLSVVEVAVEERLTGTFSIGLGYSSVDKLMAQGSIS
ncbi:MAG: outer membrane protein assembly factor BamA, partial [Pelovirga sp.]